MIAIAERAENAADVIARLSEKLAALLAVHAETIQQAILDRERTRTTALANGAAIPHCRMPALSRFGIAVMVLQQPVRWDDNGHTVDTVVMIAGPSENVPGHLRILANSSQLLDSPGLRSKLKRAPDARSAYDLIAAAEEAVEHRRSQEGMLRELRRDQENGADYLSTVAEKFDW